MPAPKSTSLSDIIDTRYYGGKLSGEIEKARKYQESTGEGAGINYGKITEKIPYTERDSGEPSYSPTENRVNIFSEKNLNNAINNWKNSVKENPREANEWAIMNGFESADDLTREMTSPDYKRSVLEHEYGHPYSRGAVIKDEKNKKNLYFDASGKYMGDPVELVNGLGRIQRETFQMSGRRFENPMELKTFVDSTPFEEATNGYSEEAKRTWRVLYDNSGIESRDPKAPLPLLQWSSRIVPALVQVNKQFEGAI